MSNMNRIIPLVIVTGVGIWNGLYVFQPAFEGQKEEKEKTFNKQHGGVETGSPQESASQDLAAKTPNAVSADVQKAVQAASQQPVAPKDASGSKSWFSSWGLAWPGSKANSEAEQLKLDASKPLEQQLPSAKTQDKSDK